MTGLKAPRGTFDVLPPDGRRRLRLLQLAEEVLGRAGYEYFESPVFEDTELFARGVGESTDIVQKEMFTFEDKGGRSLTLRPEATAAVCRAYIEHGMHKLAQPVKLWTWGPFFRHEAPQAGRYRQFTQVDAEVLGSDEPSVDAELVLLLAELLERAGVPQPRLRISSLGTAASRRQYADELRAYLREHEADLSDDVRERINANPLRAFDSDHEGTRQVMGGAPVLIERLDPDDAEHFEEVKALLDGAGLAYEVDHTLVRGLDYYTRTVFEFESDRLGAQRGVGGGGRYDGLIEQLGGPATPGNGWAAGIERILLASDEAPSEGGRRVFVSFNAKPFERDAFKITHMLRAAGAHVEMEQAGRSMKGQFKHADRLGATLVVLVGDQLEVKDMESGEQEPVADVAEIVSRL